MIVEPQYRRAALSGEVATRVRDLIRDICGQHEVQIVKGHIAKDHVHLMVSGSGSRMITVLSATLRR